MHTSLFDLSPLLRMMLMGVVLAAGPLLWVLMRNRRATPLGRLQALTLVTLFLTFDLVLFGAFTRLTDSGLGCPDWPGCYGSASPVGAVEHINAAQAALPSGPVTHGKAWVEMVHRYLATAVGVLITVLTISAWLVRNRKAAVQVTAPSPWWPTFTLVWVCIQGAFGAFTVTMKLFPAIVSLHLLGGYVLLALLTVQAVSMANPMAAQRGAVSTLQRAWMWFALAVLLVQVASGAWVSTNYAVLACTEFPKCQGVWLPSMEFAKGFEVWRPLGFGTNGEAISFQSLTAIHIVHRTLAMLTLLVLGALAWLLRDVRALHKPVRLLAGLLALQLATGLSNVVLGWPLAAAVLHTGGAGALGAVLVWLLTASAARAPADTMNFHTNPSPGGAGNPQPRFAE
jgi:cytochrome c oxidase assembly protein subunit 15